MVNHSAMDVVVRRHNWQSGQRTFLDASGNTDRNNCWVFLLMTYADTYLCGTTRATRREFPDTRCCPAAARRVGQVDELRRGDDFVRQTRRKGQVSDWPVSAALCRQIQPTHGGH